MRYSVASLIKHSFSGHKNWEPAWRDPEPQQKYDVILVGAGHGLATAYYLTKEHGITSVAVLEKGWLGSGNIGRNTTIIRSNYMLPENNPFYEWSMKLWEILRARSQFQRDGIATRRPQPLPLGRSIRCLCPTRECNAHRRGRCAITRRRRGAEYTHFWISKMPVFLFAADYFNRAAVLSVTTRSLGVTLAQPTFEGWT